MRHVTSEMIETSVADLMERANYCLRDDVEQALAEAQTREESTAGQGLLNALRENSRIARTGDYPLCQDTGTAVVFVELGRDVKITGDLYGAINRGVARATRRGYLRASMVADPLRRENTKDNTPAIIHLDSVAGSAIRLYVMPKGAGSENMSRLWMLLPGEGVSGVKRVVLETLTIGGSSACPPLVVGIGLGGSFDSVPLLAKRALMRPLNSPNDAPHLATLESDLLDAINALGIGPGGLGGRVTALSVAIEAAPCHIASLPVAVNLGCHAMRGREAVL